MDSFIENLLLGFAISAVPGAVFFETIRRGLINFSSMLIFLAGNFSGMIIVIFSSLFGSAVLINNLVISSLFYIVSGAVLLYLGVSAMKQDRKSLEVASKSSFQLRFAYIAGLVLSVANPLSYLFWVSLTGKFLKEQQGMYQAVASIMTVLLGAILLFMVLLVAIKLSKNWFTIGRLVVLSRVFGAIIASYGLVTLWNGL